MSRIQIFAREGGGSAASSFRISSIADSGISQEMTIRLDEAYGEKETWLDYNRLGNWLKR